jgi:dTDP-4-amino-4,6-dideoxygalactose transaminase
MFGEAFDKKGNRFYFSESLGYNYVLNPIQAKFASNKLKEYNMKINKIIKNAKKLSKILEKSSFIVPPKIPNACKHVFHFYRITIDPSKSSLNLSASNLRQTIQNILEKEGISTRHYQTIPLPLQPVFFDYLKSKPKFEDYPNTSPHYFTNDEFIDKYIEIFEKIEKNKDKIIEYSKKIKYAAPWKKYKGFSDTKSGYFK